MTMQSKKDPLLTQALDRYTRAWEAFKPNRELMVDDQKFLAGEQWPDDIRKDRESCKRPIQTINRLPAFIDQVVGDARQNKPSIRVHPMEDGDVDVAEVYNGIIRAIEAESNADFAYDTAIEHAAGHGFGAWRIVLEYAGEDTFDQVIRIRRITNPLNVLFDPSSTEPDYSDSEYAFVIDSMSKDEYKRRWPNAAETDFQSSEAEMPDGWQTDNTVQVAEYWYKHREKATLYLLRDGTTTFDEPPLPEAVVSKRQTFRQSVRMCIMSGDAILERVDDYLGTLLPVVGVNGKEDMVDGRRTLRGLVRFAKDPQRMYNYWRTIDTETKALAPKAPVMATVEQLEGLDAEWTDALMRNKPFLPYNHMPDQPMPQRLQVGMPDTGAERAAMMAVDEIKSTTGIFSASLGESGNEVSGRAILARQREGDTATFAYIDNLSRAIRYSGRVLLDLIPKVYTGERVLQIIGEDGKRKDAPVNQMMINPMGETEVDPRTDLRAGKYDLTVAVGPSFGTRRIESAESMIAFAQAVPNAASIIADKIAESMDWPGAETIAKRLRMMLPPGIQEVEDGKPAVPPEVQQLIEQGKAMLDEAQQRIKALEDEVEDKDEDRRLKQYEIDVRATLESAKLALTSPPDANAIAMQVAQILAQGVMGTAAAQPDITEEDEGPESPEQPEPPEPPEQPEMPMQGGVVPPELPGPDVSQQQLAELSQQDQSADVALTPGDYTG